MKKKIGLILMVLCVQAAQAQSVGVAYISPNNDGVQDSLVVPIKITDKRYIAEWTLVIRNEDGNTARTISNKETRPQKMGFVAFWKAVFSPKKGVNVPQTITWDGTLDSGETAPDGTYFYYVEAADDNGNRSKSKELQVIVDNTPPEIELVQPPETDKFFGEGVKATLRINQSGSEEDLWTAAFFDTAGGKARTIAFRNSAPQDLQWDGKNDNGAPVADGVYSYSIEATDRAGNSSPAVRISNIIYSGEKPVVGITISGSRYFSPQTASPLKTITLAPNIPAPKTGNSLVNWKISVRNEAGKIFMTYSGTGTVPAEIIFDGIDENKNLMPEGQYQAVVAAGYLNGYQTAPAFSPAFTLKRTPPSAELRVENDIFSPDGDEVLDTVVVAQNFSFESAPWKGEIVRYDGTVVKTIELGTTPSKTAVWNGLDDAGNLCSDDTYLYRVSCVDLAGNSTEVTSVGFKLDTSKTEIILAASPAYFSPNGDRVQDAVMVTPSVKSQASVISYDMVIKDESGAVVRSFNGRALPTSFVWDGKNDAGGVCPDGSYTAVLDAVSANGAKTVATAPRFILDTKPPEASVSAAWTLFSPDGDSLKDTVPFAIKTSKERRWTGVITAVSGAGGNNASGNVVRSYTWFDTDAPSFEWDGTDESGNIAPDGAYQFTLSAQDEAGNQVSVSLENIVADARPARAWVTAEHDVIAPNGRTKSQNFTLNASLKQGVESWTFTVAGDRGAVFTRTGTGDTVPETIAWDGTAGDNGAIAEGSFTGSLSLVYKKGNRVAASAAPFICTGLPPVVAVKISPEYFSPDNDGVDDDLDINLSARSLLPFASWSFTVFDPQSLKPFWTTGGSSKITEKLVWQGKGVNGELAQSAVDYPYTFTVTDVQGQSASVDGIIPVDILVIRDGNVLRIRIPSIIFRANKADFVGKDVDPKDGLSQVDIDRNNTVLRRTAFVLNKFKDYTITIEGHANSISGAEWEETSTASGNIPLVPLSKDRAEYVKAALVKLGVNASRLSTIGIGGRRPVASRADIDNRWKNRRVEFILHK
ncbi:MAG: OmpA family protein [Treponema sp.]|jgi:flagellar hook assembly protein FlgD|nr:OmpA family protein [Treponema sp.]